MANAAFVKGGVNLLLSFLGALVVALGTGNDASFNKISLTKWLVAMGTVLGSSAMVAVVDNVPGIAGGIAKAVIAFLSAGFASLVIALNDNHITQAELLIAVIAAVTAAGAVYQVNDKAPSADLNVITPGHRSP